LNYSDLFPHKTLGYKSGLKKWLKRKETIYKAVKPLPTSIQEKRIPRAETPCIPYTKRNKRKESMGTRRVASSSLCLILVTRAERSVLKSASGANKFMSVLDSMSMKLQSKHCGFMSVKNKLYKVL